MAAVHLYVSQANGDDGFDGLTPATAKASYADAVRTIPEVIYNPWVIHAGAGTYDLYPMTHIHQAIAQARVWVVGDGAGQAGDDGFTIDRAAELAAGGSGTQVIVTSGGMTLNEHAGRTVEVVSGPGAGEFRTIASNTTTDIIPSADFTTAITTGSTFRVVSSNVLLNSDVVGADGQRGVAFSGMGTLLSSFNVGAFLGLVNLEITGSNPGGPVNLSGMSQCGVLMHGVRQSAFGFQVAQCNVNCGETSLMGIQSGVVVSNPYADLGYLTTRGALWNGWGLTLTSGGAFAFQGFNSKVSGYFQTPGELQFGELSSVEIKGGWVGKLTATTGAYVRINSAGAPVFTVEGNDALAACLATQDATISNAGPGHVFNNAGAGACIRADQGGKFIWASSSVRPTGASVGGPGMMAAGGQIFFEDAVPLVTGSSTPTNDTELDDGTQGANSVYSGAGTGISNLGSVIQRTV